MTLCSSTAPLLAELCAPDTPYFGYRSLLERALLSRLLAQLSQVYSTLTITSLLELVSPLEGLGPEQVEAFLMGCARRGERSVYVDHATGTITFIDEGFVVSSEDPIPSTSTNSEASIQPSAAELVRTRLSTLAVTLHNSLAVLYPPPQLSFEEEEAAQHAKFVELVAAANAERHALSLRRALVARRRELLSELSARKEKEEASRRAETTRREKDEEVRRAKLEIAKKERERAQKEVDSIRAEEAKKLAQTLIKKGNLKVSVDVRMLFQIAYYRVTDMTVHRKWKIYRQIHSCACKSSNSNARRKSSISVCAPLPSESITSSVRTAKKSGLCLQRTTRNSRPPTAQSSKRFSARALRALARRSRRT